MRVISTYIDLENLRLGRNAFADVEVDLQRDDGKLTIIRIELKPGDVWSYARGSSNYNNSNSYKELSKADCLKTIKNHIGQVVANKLFEDEEKLLELNK